MPVPASGPRGPREPDTGYASVPEVPARLGNQHDVPGHARCRSRCTDPGEILRVDAPPSRDLRNHPCGSPALCSRAADAAWERTEPVGCARFAGLYLKPESWPWLGDRPGLCGDGSDVRAVSD